MQAICLKISDSWRDEDKLSFRSLLVVETGSGTFHRVGVGSFDIDIDDIDISLGAKTALRRAYDESPESDDTRDVAVEWPRERNLTGPGVLNYLSGWCKQTLRLI